MIAASIVTVDVVLRFDDPLPRRPERILVAGVSGVGKTTLARQISAQVGAPHVEIDSLYHGPAWVPRPEFLDEVRALAVGGSWVTEWQYSSARPILAARAHVLVWLDLPFLTVALPRVIRRTVRRRAKREVLWNGNVEPPLRTFFTEPQHIVRWAIATRGTYTSGVPEVETEYPELSVVRLRSQRQVQRWLTGPLPAALR
jgi:hypothetical protein